MRGRNKLYRWLFAFWILIGSASAVSAQTTLPAAWRTTPTLSTDMQPAYQFRSTSAYTPTMNVTVYSPGSSSPARGPRRDPRNPWDEDYDEEGDPNGDAIGTQNTPVGEPFILLLFAMLYILIGRQGWKRLKWRT